MTLDVAIVGAGPTGILAAFKLLESGFKVALIESGDWDSEFILTKRHYEFFTPSKMPDGIHRIGGGSNLWHGRVSKFPEACFRRSDSTGRQVWPMDFSVIERRYKELASIVGFKPIEDDGDSLSRIHTCKNCNSVLRTSLYQFIKPDTFRNLLWLIAQNTRFFLHTNTYVERIESHSNEMVVTNCKVDSVEGSRLVIKSRFLILAAGCLQSTALVQRSSPETVENSFIGNYLMEHFDGFVGTLKVKTNNLNCLQKLALDKTRRLSGTEFGFGILAASENRLEWHLEICPYQRTYNFDPVANRFNLPMRLLKVLFFLERCIIFIPNRVHRMYLKARKVEIFSLWLKGEEEPYYLSKVKSGQGANLVYRHEISPSTIRIMKSQLRDFAKTISKTNLGKIRFSLHFQIPKFLNTGGNFHPMGTMRMHVNEWSAVNPDSSLSGFTNVYCVDSSVFPSGAHQNPTAMALTLALETIAQVSQQLRKD